jgi:hypothetical protein
MRHSTRQSIGTVGEVWQRLVLLSGAGGLALRLPSLPSVQAQDAEHFFSALDVVLDVVIKEIRALHVAVSAFLVSSAPFFAVDLRTERDCQCMKVKAKFLHLEYSVAC